MQKDLAVYKELPDKSAILRKCVSKMKKIPMELRQLEYFRMTAKLRNLTRAAAELEVSQPNITVAIQKLESLLGLRLFDRSQKQVLLTAEGEIFLRRVEPALDILHDALRELEDYKNLSKGNIRIGIPPMIGAYLFPRICSDFQKIYPHLTISLYEEGSMAIRENLEAGELDFGIIILSDIPAALNTFPMCTSELVACVPEDSPLASRPSFRLKDFDNENLIVMKHGSFIRRMLSDRFASMGISPNVVLESNQIEIIKHLVANGIGLACLLDCVTKGNQDFRVLSFNRPMHFDVGLAWKKDRYISKAAAAFMDFCKETLID